MNDSYWGSFSVVYEREKAHVSGVFEMYKNIKEKICSLSGDDTGARTRRSRCPAVRRSGPANFRGLVLGCINAKFCKKICV